ncbi:hypothetical protein C8R43DRAFT_1138356 [Mycena crocata]|nr:hypothetical protein C8R43DRAFT_1138356 [Mycena crocata]
MGGVRAITSGGLLGDASVEAAVAALDAASRQTLPHHLLITYFVQHIRLCEILDTALRRLYASNKSKWLMGWVVRWDPDRAGVFFDQSAVLHTMFYQLQITTTIPFPSLAICTRAARGSIHVVDGWVKKMHRIPVSPMSAPFISSVVLLLNLFGVTRAGQAIDVKKEQAHITTAMAALKFFETRTIRNPTPLPQKGAVEAVFTVQGTSADDSSNTSPSTGESSSHLQQEQQRLNPMRLDLADKSVATVLAGEGTSHRCTSLDTKGGLSALSAHPMDSHAHGQQQHGGTAPAVPQDDITLEQILAATAGYDRADMNMVDMSALWLGNSPGNWDSVGFQNHAGTGYANANMMPVDDEMMALWMVAPTNFR